MEEEVVVQKKTTRCCEERTGERLGEEHKTIFPLGSKVKLSRVRYNAVLGVCPGKYLKKGYDSRFFDDDTSIIIQSRNRKGAVPDLRHTIYICDVKCKLFDTVQSCIIHHLLNLVEDEEETEEEGGEGMREEEEEDNEELGMMLEGLLSEDRIIHATSALGEGDAEMVDISADLNKALRGFEGVRVTGPWRVSPEEANRILKEVL